MPYVPQLRKGPRFVALTAAIERDVRSGHLVPGVRLPGTRTLATQLGMSRNTVVRAYADLAAQGWVETRRGGGTFICAELASVASGALPSASAGFVLPAARTPMRTERGEGFRYRLVGGQPDLRTLPLDELGRAVRRVLRGRGRQLADYGDPRGGVGIRSSLAGWLNTTRGMRVDAENLVVTRGAQQALFLSAQVLFRPGDRVAVEELGYAPAWDALRLSGVELVPVPLDAWGLRVDALKACGPLAGVYLTPHHQYPTGAMLSMERRAELLRLARQHRWAVLEDDYDHEFHWDGPPRNPLAARDGAGVVVYIGTLSKAFAPGLRVGWVTGPPPFVERLAALRRTVDRQGDAVGEAAVSALLGDGSLQRHTRRMYRVYAGRRQRVVRLLRELFPQHPVRVPPGGLAVWLRTGSTPLGPWLAAARAREVYVASHETFQHRPGVGEPGLRIGFSALDEEELEEALWRLALARPWKLDP